MLPKFVSEMAVMSLIAFLSSVVLRDRSMDPATPEYPWTGFPQPADFAPGEVVAFAPVMEEVYYRTTTIVIPTGSTCPAGITCPATLPVFTIPRATATEPVANQTRSATGLPTFTNPSDPPAPEEDDIEEQISRLPWLADLLFAVVEMLLVAFMTLCESSNLLGFFLRHHVQVFVAKGRTIRALRLKIAALQANPVLVALPLPTSDENLNETSRTASTSTQTEATPYSVAQGQTIRALRLKIAALEANPVLVALPPPTTDENLYETGRTASTGTQTEAASYSSIGTQTAGTKYVSVSTQTDPVESPSVGTQTEAPASQSASTQTSPSPDASSATADREELEQLRAEMAETVQLRAKMAEMVKRKEESDELMKALQSGRADVGRALVELQAQVRKLELEREQQRQQRQQRQQQQQASSGQAFPAGSFMPNPQHAPGTAVRLAPDLHHNPNPEANAQRLARNMERQQEQLQWQQTQRPGQPLPYFQQPGPQFQQGPPQFQPGHPQFQPAQLQFPPGPPPPFQQGQRAPQPGQQPHPPNPRPSPRWQGPPRR